ncbi:MAG: redox-regulated ATPase YchF [Anaerolineae bacterium]|nr:redox-regulated ATPase YchF [Anaerolineae bacterium]
MRLGIIGLPNSGKTTLFNALTGNRRETGAVSSGKLEVFNGAVSVPDERVDKLSAMYQPKKTIYASVTFSDFGGVDKGFSEGGLAGQFKNEMAQVDGFVHVVRAFEDDGIPHPYVSIDPKRDVEIVDGEFILSDLIAVEKRLERLQEEIRRAKKVDVDKINEEVAFMERLKAALENETPLRGMDMSEEEEKQIRGFGFFSQKPLLIVFNMGEAVRAPEDIMAYTHRHSRLVSLQGKIEEEISQLDTADQEVFLEEYGISEPSYKRVIRLSYELLGVQSFFTVGKDEVRAWTIPVGATAPEAASVIHTDLQKGFVRAEVTPYQDLLALGSEAAVKDAGKMRLEGKTYIVQDGDIMHIRSSK